MRKTLAKNKFASLLFALQTKENLSLSAQAAQVVELKSQLSEFEEKKTLVEQLTEKVAQLETEVSDVKKVMEDNDAETKIQLEVLEKEKRNKDQV